MRGTATAFEPADFKHQPSLHGPEQHAAGVLLLPTLTERASKPEHRLLFSPTVAPKAFLPQHR